jgi:hypothetical protein
MRNSAKNRNVFRFLLMVKVDDPLRATPHQTAAQMLVYYLNDALTENMSIDDAPFPVYKTCAFALVDATAM